MVKGTTRDADRVCGSLSPVDPDVLYPLEVFQQITGLGKAAMRSARNAGLRVDYVAGRGWVFGRDWIDHVRKCGAVGDLD